MLAFSNNEIKKCVSCPKFATNMFGTRKNKYIFSNIGVKNVKNTTFDSACRKNYIHLNEHFFTLNS